MKKKAMSLILALILLLSCSATAQAISVQAATPSASITIRRLTPRTKDDTSAVYFYYRDGNRDHIRARALGGSAQNGSMNNCTVSGGTRVNYVTCHNGNKYSIHSFINEDGYCWATLSFSCPNLFGETLSGEWSPDSANSYKDATP